MVLAGLLGSTKPLRRRSSAASSGLNSLNGLGDCAARNQSPRPDRVSRNDGGRSTLTGNNAVSGSSGDVSPLAMPAPACVATPDYIADESHLAPVAAEPPDLRVLNHSLDALAAVFPDVQPDVFREMLTNFDGESRLALVADALLKNRATWVKGRWRVADKNTDGEGNDGDDSNDGGEGGEGGDSNASFSAAPFSSPAIAPADRFRTPEYRKAAQALASHEFMGLSRSTIQAVLAEQNYAYLEARRALVAVAARSWRFTLSSLLLRRKPVTTTEAENHPLVVWKSTGQGSIVPTVRATGCAELDRELYAALVAPLRRRQRVVQEQADRAAAVALNTAEAEAADALFECACCFGSATFEQVTTCSHADAAHVVCFRCVQHSVREAVFGQGWARTIDTARGTLRCPAVDRHDCPGIIPVDHLHRALLDAPRGADTLRHLERRLADLSLAASGLPLVRCPFCAYAEIDDLYVPVREAPLRVRADSLSSLAVLLLLSGVTPVLLLPALALLVLVALLPALLGLTHQLSFSQQSIASVWRRACSHVGRSTAHRSQMNHHHPHPHAHQHAHHHQRQHKHRPPPPPQQPSYLRSQIAAAITRFRRRRRGQQFRCQHPACGRLSCLGCGQAWTDIHVCHESSLVALRTQVEQAMSMAIKRVCPRCNTAFVKAVGCNKLTCPCGYKMCYVCRKDIGAVDGPDAGYRHFCDHFRPHGDGRPCTQCRKCNLWETEDTEAVLQAAREAAERRWRETEQRDLSIAERAYLETGIAIGGGTAGGSYSYSYGGGSGSSKNNNSASRHAGLPSGARLLSRTARWAASPFTGLGLGPSPKHITTPLAHDDTARPPTLAEFLDWLLEAIFV